MLYTIIGIIIGGTIGGLKKTAPSPNFANLSQMFNIIVGMSIGGGIGFGIGVTSLANGTHLVQKAFKSFKKWKD